MFTPWLAMRGNAARDCGTRRSPNGAGPQQHALLDLRSDFGNEKSCAGEAHQNMRGRVAH